MQKYFIQTFGCAMNYSDSDRIRHILDAAGYKETTNDTAADILILNTCTVREGASHKISGYQRKVMDLRRENKKVFWIITGCEVKKTSLRTDETPDKLIKSLKELDATLRIEDIQLLPELLEKKQIQTSESLEDKTHAYLSVTPSFEKKLTALIPIMTGCNNFCTYCAVPYARGREVSRPIEDILIEAKNAIQAGVSEIVLLGQNVNSYEYNFPELLRKINNLEGKFWIRFTSSHPKDATVELFQTMVDCEKIPPHLHLPAQNGVDATLKRMNRKYTTADYKNLIQKFREICPDYALTTDWIVGFCNETDADFKQSLEFYKELNFDMVFHAKYSERPGTYATKNLEDSVSEAEKSARWEELNTIMKSIAWEKNKLMTGKNVEFLVEKVENDISHGRTGENKMAIFMGELEVGKFYKKTVKSVDKWQLELE